MIDDLFSLLDAVAEMIGAGAADVTVVAVDAADGLLATVGDIGCDLWQHRADTVAHGLPGDDDDLMWLHDASMWEIDSRRQPPHEGRVHLSTRRKPLRSRHRYDPGRAQSSRRPVPPEVVVALRERLRRRERRPFRLPGKQGWVAHDRLLLEALAADPTRGLDEAADGLDTQTVVQRLEMPYDRATTEGRAWLLGFVMANRDAAAWLECRLK